MITNERPSPYIHQREPSFRPPVQDTTLKTVQMQIERKTITVILKENHQGRFFRIIEELRGHRNTVIIPADGLAQFQELLNEAAQAEKALPPYKRTKA
jgi:hypothetical protein